MCLAGRQRGGFDIRFGIAASPKSECQIQTALETLFAGVLSVLTFVNEPSEAQYECQDRDASASATAVRMSATENGLLMTS
jgi:hypothetical protein